MMKRIAEVTVISLITVACIEVALYLCVRAGLLDVPLPSYTLVKPEPFWQADSKLPYGVWHRPNAFYRHKLACQDVSYQSNVFGMRDHDVPQRSAERRIAILGDSFAEGYGVAYGERFSELLEVTTGLEHLNFGTAGGFGPTQALLLYQNLVSQFDHSAVILALLPNNDFLDDESTAQKLKTGAPHRPYLVGTYPNYTITYPPEGKRNDRKWYRKLTAALREFSILLQAIKYIDAARRARSEAGGAGSFYYDYTPEQLQRLTFVLERLKASADTRPILVVTIPRPEDYLRSRRENKVAPLTEALTALAARIGFDYFDLLANAPADFKDLFLTCDGHWSARGHQAAADVLKGWRIYGEK